MMGLVDAKRDRQDSTIEQRYRWLLNRQRKQPVTSKVANAVFAAVAYQNERILEQ